MSTYERTSGSGPLSFLFWFSPTLSFISAFTERQEKEKLETDAMYKLDHEGKDKEKLKKALPSLTDIIDYQSRWKDDYQLNSAIRRKFRVNHSCRLSSPLYNSSLWFQ